MSIFEENDTAAAILSRELEEIYNLNRSDFVACYMNPTTLVMHRRQNAAGGIDFLDINRRRAMWLALTNRHPLDDGDEVPLPQFQRTPSLPAFRAALPSVNDETEVQTVQAVAMEVDSEIETPVDTHVQILTNKIHCWECVTATR